MSGRRITFVVGHLGLGGAERMICLMSAFWAERGDHTEIVTLTHGQRPPVYDVHPQVKWTDVDFSSVRRRALPKLRTLACLRELRRAIRRTRPDLVVSFLSTTNVFTLLATLGMRVPVIVSERNDPHFDLMDPRRTRLREWLYPMATRLVVQTNGALNYFNGRSRQRGVVIPNPVVVPPGAGLADPASSRVVVGLGRLAEQKRFDWLIEAFAKAAADRPDWTLEIWGEGDERASLEALVAKLGLRDRVRLPGLTRDAVSVLRRGSIFVLSSRYEGFPNALCEAMATGLPAVSFNCPSGPSDIVRHGTDGMLVPVGDVDGLARHLRLLITDSATRIALAKRAPEVIERFSLARVMAMWDAQFQEALS
jgi:GalNAc-alpha-(1->4)-GalNAc-alpha-(1->3)-diNAcBac-PP-undecaprenol alpha-1,4-N-acetyl-D-galactosaminyltransferase